jgi:hypothetical protein
MAVALVGGDVATARSTGDVDLILEPIDPSLPAPAVLRVSCLGQWSCRCAGALMQATGTSHESMTSAQVFISVMGCLLAQKC